MGKEIKRISIGAFVSGIIHLAIFSFPIPTAHMITIREIPRSIELSLVARQHTRLAMVSSQAIEEKRTIRPVQQKIKAIGLTGEAFVRKTLPMAEVSVKATGVRGEAFVRRTLPMAEACMKAQGLSGEAFVERTLPMAAARVRVSHIQQADEPKVVKVDRQESPTLAIPQYQVNPKPSYPEVARRRGYQGKVRLEVEVLASGRVGNIRIKKSSGYEVLDRCALKTVQGWRFIPAKLSGVPVKSSVVIPITFHLKD